MRSRRLIANKIMTQDVEYASDPRIHDIKKTFRKHVSWDKTIPVTDGSIQTHLFCLDILKSHEVAMIFNPPLDKMAAVSQTIFSDAFTCMKSFVFRLNLH